MAAICVAGGAGVFVLAPGSVRDWAIGVISAALAGYLSAGLPPWLRKTLSSVPAPVVVTAEVLKADYMRVDDLDGRPAMVPASGHMVRLVVEATNAQAIVLRGLSPVIVSRGQATGSLHPHAGIVQPRPFSLSLDSDPPVLQPGDGGPDFPFRVTAADPEVFEITAHLGSGYARWFLELHWTSGGRRGSSRIDLAGHPFVTIARPVPRPAAKAAAGNVELTSESSIR